MENQEYEMENETHENAIKNQTDVTIGEDCCDTQEELADNQTIEETSVFQENETTENAESCNEETLANETALQEDNETANEAKDLETEQLEDYQLEPQDAVLEDNETPIGVYAKYDENGNVKEVNSDIFIKDFTGWTKIDEGFGDRYAHAQSQYFLPEE